MSQRDVVFTLDPVLHPGARHDFQSHVDALLAQGRHDAAASLWSAVVEIQHLPVPEVPVLGGYRLGSMATVVCTEPNCERCRTQRGGYQFPWLGRWCRQAVLRRAAANPSEAWREWSECATKLDVLQLAMHGSHLRRQDMLPPEWEEVLSRASRYPGCAPLGVVFKIWRQWQLGSVVWVDPFAVPAPSRSEALASEWS